MKVPQSRKYLAVLTILLLDRHHTASHLHASLRRSARQLARPLGETLWEVMTGHEGKTASRIILGAVVPHP
jgi:hypothetical protein